MLKIRLQRIGRKNDPHFRLVITPSERKNKTTKFLEILGTYNVKAGEFECKADRVKHWIAMGAQVSPTVTNLLISKGILEERSTYYQKKLLLNQEKKSRKKQRRNNLFFCTGFCSPLIKIK